LVSAVAWPSIGFSFAFLIISRVSFDNLVCGLLWRDFEPDLDLVGFAHFFNGVAVCPKSFTSAAGYVFASRKYSSLFCVTDSSPNFECTSQYNCSRYHSWMGLELVHWSWPSSHRPELRSSRPSNA
jgi:hypothetical protein